MHQDEFNSFQHADSHQTQKLDQKNQQIEHRIKDQGIILTNSFLNFDIENVNPSSSLATTTFQQLSENTDNKDFEDSDWPSFNKFQSQSLPSLETNLVTFQKSYSQSQYKRGIFWNQSTFNSQNKVIIDQNVTPKKEQLATNQSQDINFTQSSKLFQSFIPFAPIHNSITNHSSITNHNIQLKDRFPFENNIFTNETPVEYVQISQNNKAIIKDQDNIQKLQVQSGSRKQSEQFVFQAQKSHFQAFQAQDYHINEQVNLQDTQKVVTNADLQLDIFNQCKSDTQLPLSTNEQVNIILDSKVGGQYQKMVQQIQEEDQFGDFEVTVESKFTQQHQLPQKDQLTQQNQFSQYHEFTPQIKMSQRGQTKAQNDQWIVQIYEKLMPFGVNSFQKKKQLQQLINSLPNYSSIFANALQQL